MKIITPKIVYLDIEESMDNEDIKKKSYKVFIKRTKSFKVSNTKLPGVKNFWILQDDKQQVKQWQKQNIGEKLEPRKKQQKLTGSERYKKYMDEEERIKRLEDEMDDPNFVPHTPDQFERELLKDKNSSFMFIKYMALYLETAEIDKSRSIAKRAIASINYREEKELMNVWLAWLNLEIRYGSDETYQEVLCEAAQRNNPFKIYSQTLLILLQLEKFTESIKIIDILKKKFKFLPEMWIVIAEAYLKMDNEKLAKELLPRSLLSLVDKDRKYKIDFLFGD